ncbi:MFS transporter [Faecalicatena contorta]|nr:MFS transporter [Faecalicatena contorta]
MKKRTLIFVNIIITCIATSLLQTALTTALPPIIADFGISVTTGQWLTSAYSLVMATMMPLTAYLVTRIPTRRLYIVTIVIFAVGTGVCMFAPNFLVLLTGRILQACSNGITSAMGQVILLSIYPVEKRGTIMGWYGLSAGAAPVIAPTLAGILVDLFSWRMIFVCTFVVMIVSLVYAMIVMEMRLFSPF